MFIKGLQSSEHDTLNLYPSSVKYIKSLKDIAKTYLNDTSFIFELNNTVKLIKFVKKPNKHMTGSTKLDEFIV